MTYFSKVPMFSKEDWKMRMQAHLAAQDDDMWYVITDGPLKILKPNTAVAVTDGAPQIVEKPRSEWTGEDKKKANLNNVANEILYKTLDKIPLARSRCKFENLKMNAKETLNEFDERFSSLVNELAALGKEYDNREIALKVMRALPRE
ncbi:uncharacterized protein [Primulina eburnea]|uniref:uncharacterized protein n=1 Tax=Primulina eburnea TaxID=1245227 RepID=UPI003C6C4875